MRIISGIKNKEIDIVVDNPCGKMFIEVKYRQTASVGKEDAIFVLADNADSANSAIVVTKREDDYGVQASGGENKIMRIPAFAYLYLPGNAEKNGFRGAR